MAKRTIFMLIDDLDGGDADETISFAFDGVQYTIDLNEKNAGRLRDVLEPYRLAAQRISGRSSVAARSSQRGSQPHVTPRASSPEQNRAIREWAETKGFPVSDRGRIKQAIVEQFEREHAPGGAEKPSGKPAAGASNGKSNGKSKGRVAQPQFTDA